MRIIISRRAAIFASLAITVLLVSYLSIFYYPLRKEIWDLEREISSFENSSGTDGIYGLNLRCEELANEKQALLDKAGSYLQALPSEVTESDIITLLSDVGLGSASRQSILFLQPVRMDFYIINPIILSFKTNYEGLMKTLTELDSLDICLSIPNIRLSPQGSSPKSGDAVNSDAMFDPKSHLMYNIDVEMTIYFFSQPGQAVQIDEAEAVSGQ